MRVEVGFTWPASLFPSVQNEFHSCIVFIDDSLLTELKAVQDVLPIHKAQLLRVCPIR